MILKCDLPYEGDKSATRQFLDMKFEQAGISISNTIEISSLEGIKQGFIHGLA